MFGAFDLTGWTAVAFWVSTVALFIGVLICFVKLLYASPRSVEVMGLLAAIFSADLWFFRTKGLTIDSMSCIILLIVGAVVGLIGALINANKKNREIVQSKPSAPADTTLPAA